MLLSDPFDVAPDHKRQKPLAWAVLLIGACLLAASSVQVLRAYENLRATHIALADVQSQVNGRARALQATQPRAEAVEARLALQQALNASWTELFEVLERSTESLSGRVTITSLAPVRLQSASAEVHLTTLAISDDVMLEFIGQLDSAPGVSRAQLLNRQTASLGGRDVVRFQVRVLWSPVQAGTYQPSSVMRTGHAKP